MAVETLCAVTEAVGLDLVLRAYEGQAPSLRDTGQLELAQQLWEEAHASWQPSMELAVGEHGQAIDLCFFGPSEILAVEIERLAIDWQAQPRRADVKRRSLASRHQRPVRLVMAVEDRRRNRAALAAHLGVVRVALPAGSREVLAALRRGRPLGRDGLLWIRRRRKAP